MLIAHPTRTFQKVFLIFPFGGKMYTATLVPQSLPFHPTHFWHIHRALSKDLWVSLCVVVQVLYWLHKLVVSTIAPQWNVQYGSIGITQPPSSNPSVWVLRKNRILNHLKTWFSCPEILSFSPLRNADNETVLSRGADLSYFLSQCQTPWLASWQWKVLRTVWQAVQYLSSLLRNANWKISSPHSHIKEFRRHTGLLAT